MVGLQGMEQGMDILLGMALELHILPALAQGTVVELVLGTVRELGI